MLSIFWLKATPYPGTGIIKNNYTISKYKKTANQ